MCGRLYWKEMGYHSSMPRVLGRCGHANSVYCHTSVCKFIRYSHEIIRNVTDTSSQRLLDESSLVLESVSFLAWRRCTSLKPLQNGFVVLSYPCTNFQSPLVSSSPPLSTTPRRTSRPMLPTAFQPQFNSSGRLFLLLECFSFLRCVQ